MPQPDPSFADYVRFAVTLAAILNPFAAIPFFLIVTRDGSGLDRRTTAAVAAATVAFILGGSAVAGDSFLTLAGTSLGAFRVAGGIVLLLMGLSMLGAQPGAVRQTQEEMSVATQQGSVAVVPIGIPLIAGPGSISAVIVQMQRGAGLGHLVAVLACVAAVSLACWLSLRFAKTIGRVLGPLGLNVVSRLLGLLLSAVAVEMMAAGAKQLFPALAG
jgi:multiple antibiotic resistance protein